MEAELTVTANEVVKLSSNGHQTEVNQVLDIQLWMEIQVDQFPLLLG